jgi:hypothetical protein
VAAGWGDLQANLVRLGVGDRIQPHRNDEVDVVVVVVSGRGELTLACYGAALLASRWLARWLAGRLSSAGCC